MQYEQAEAVRVNVLVMRSLNDILTAVAERFDLQLERSNPAGGGFSGAEVFRVVAADGREFAFRKTPQKFALPEERLRALHGLLAAVHRSGVVEISVPRIPGARINSDSPQDISLLTGKAAPSPDPWIRFGTDLWQVEPWMPGSSISRGEVSQQHQQSALHRLHDYHAAAADHVSQGNHSVWFRNSQEPSPAILRRQKITEELLNGGMETLWQQAASDPDPCFRNSAFGACRVLSDRLTWLHQELTGLTKQLFAVQPVLRDVWRAHVLFTDDRVTGLIDLSAAASDHVAIDAARLLRSWFGTETGRLIDAVTEFASQQSFNRAERQLMRALDASSVLLSPLTWIRRRTGAAERGAFPPEMQARFDEVTAIAQAFEPLPME